VEPHNADIAERVENVRQLRANGEITLPSTLALEKLTNPFLRTSETSVKEKADERNGRDNRAGSEVFASLRSWKDTF
jgi:hydroxyacylglutathione hydrolase